MASSNRKLNNIERNTILLFLLYSFLIAWGVERQFITDGD